MKKNFWKKSLAMVCAFVMLVTVMPENIVSALSQTQSVSSAAAIPAETVPATDSDQNLVSAAPIPSATPVPTATPAAASSASAAPSPTEDPAVTPPLAAAPSPSVTTAPISTTTTESAPAAQVTQVNLAVSSNITIEETATAAITVNAGAVFSNGDVTWNNSDGNIATVAWVNGQFLVTPLSAGQTTISASINGVTSNAVTITVEKKTIPIKTVSFVKNYDGTDTLPVPVITLDRTGTNLTQTDIDAITKSTAFAAGTYDYSDPSKKYSDASAAPYKDAIKITGQPTMTGTFADKYTVTNTITSADLTINKIALTLTINDALTYNGKAAGYENVGATLSGIKDGSESTRDVKVVLTSEKPGTTTTQSPTAIQAGTGETVYVTYPSLLTNTAAGGLSTVDYDLPESINVDVSPAHVKFSIQPADKYYDGTTTVNAITITCDTDPVGDDYKTGQAEPFSISDSVTAAHFIFSNKGSIDRDENVGVIENTNFPDPILLKKLDGATNSYAATTNYITDKTDITIQNANIKTFVPAEKTDTNTTGQFALPKADYSEKDANGAVTTRWYKGTAVTVTAQAGYEVSLTENDVYADHVDDAAPDSKGTLTVYVKRDTDYAIGKAVIQNIKTDSGKPDITIDGAEAAKSDLQFGYDKNTKKYTYSVTYTVTVSDQDETQQSGKSGVNKNSIKYYIGTNGLDESDITGWKTAVVSGDGKSFTCKVDVPAYGYLYLSADDNVGNHAYVPSQRALVLEKNAPAITVTPEKLNDSDQEAPSFFSPTKEHIFSISASDPSDDKEPTDLTYDYSGIQKVTWSLVSKDTNKEVRSSDKEDTSYSNTAPTAMSGLPGIRTLSKNKIELSGTDLSGDYTLTVTAWDFCGNSATDTETLRFDNTAPTVDLTVGNNDGTHNKDAKENYCYNPDLNEEDKFISVKFSDDNFIDKDQSNGATASISKENYTLTITDPGGTEVVSDTINSPSNSSSTNNYVTTNYSNENGTYTCTMDVSRRAFTGKDGTYQIAITAKDYAGNVAGSFNSALGVNEPAYLNEVLSASFVIDKTAPVLEAVSSKEPQGDYSSVSENKIYYNNKVFQTTFSIAEAHYNEGNITFEAKPQNSVSGNVTFSQTITAATTEATTGNLDVTVTANIAGAVENDNYSYTLSATDAAGNKMVIAPDKKFNNNGHAYNNASVNNGTAVLSTQRVIDTTAPKVEISYSGSPNYYDEGAYYKEGFTAKFDFSDADLDTKILTAGQKYYTWDQVQGTEVLSGKGKVSKANPSSANDATNATYTFAVNAKKDGGNDGGYLFYAFGTDKAGNALTVIEKNIDKKGTSNTREDCSGADKKLDKTKNEFYLKYLDTQQPTVAIDYNEAHSYYNENLKGWVAYYNTGIIATFRFADAGSLDENKLTYRQNKEGDDGTETHFNTAQGYNLINADETLTISAQTDHSNDGTYIYYIWGEDKAGNPLQVASEKKRNSNDSESSSDRDHSSNDSAYECGKKALDTVSPTVSINYTALDATHYYNNNAYYNKDFTTIFSYIDTYGTSGNTTYGIDQTKMFKGQAGPNSNDIVWSAVGSSTESSDSERKADLTSSYTVRADANIVSDEYWYGAYGEDKAGNPLIVTENQTQGPESSAGNQTAANKDGAYKSAYRKIMDTVSPAAALSISTDSANRDLQNGRYYFNKDFNATFNVVEANYDADKMHGLYSYNGNAVNYESDTVADPSNAMDYTSGNGSYSYSFNDSSEGLYRFSVSGEDRAGNACVMSDNKNIEITQSPFTSNIVAVDKTLPKVTVSVNDFYNAVLSDGSSYSVTVNRPYQKLTDATAVFQGDDKSPAAIQYNIPSTVSGQTAGADTPYVYNNRVTSGFNAEQIIYMSTLKITDRAGNVSNMNQPTNKIYLDVTAPTNDQLAPTISLTAHASSDWRGPSGNPLFKSTVTVNAQITDPGEGVRSSGLYHVYYKITVNGEDWTTRPGIASGAGGTYNSGVMSYGTSGSSYSPTASTADERLTSHDSIDFTFDADTFNYNDVKIYVWAEDNSGNKVEENSAITYSFGIDVTAPKIAVSYDNNSAQNEKYFKADRTATIVVTERNFDPSNTKINTQDAAAVSGWSYTRGSMANGDDDKWSCTVAYTKDGDYTFGITTADLLGHDGGTPDYGSSVAPTLFVLDKTNPTITISFDNNSVANGKYYNAHRTATVLVHEHNFSSEGARVTATAQILEGTVDTPVAGTWRTVGDDNKADVPFNEDGNYTLHAAYTDLAGNVAEEKSVDEFVVDTTKPQIDIGGVQDQVAYSGDVAPSITYHDINYDNTSAGVSIVGYKHKDSENLQGTHSDDAYGGSYVCDNIVPVKANDDVYTASGTVSDLAGNVSNVDIRFSVNRFGSTYIYSDDNTKSLIDQYYTNSPQTVKITEINVSPLDTETISTSLNGDVNTLNKDSDYSVKESNPGWMQYDYEINSDNFKKEGAYSVTLYSEDKGGNKNTNNAIREDGDATTGLPVEFLVDMTAPTNIITGVEQDKQYVDTKRTVVVQFDDNTAVNDLKLYVNDEVVGEYTKDDLAKANGELQYEAKSDNAWQTFKVVSTDVAGNVSEESSVRYLLTNNLFIQYYSNKPVFISSIGGLGVLALLLLLLFKRRKKDEEENA